MKTTEKKKTIEISTGNIYLKADSTKEALGKIETLMGLGITQLTLTFRVVDKSCC